LVAADVPCDFAFLWNQAQKIRPFRAFSHLIRPFRTILKHFFIRAPRRFRATGSILQQIKALPIFADFLRQMRDCWKDYMRLIGHVKSESSAKTLGDYLVSLDIRSLIEPDAEGWAVWIYSEDQIAAGQQALSDYQLNPAADRFLHASQNAAVVEDRKKREKAIFDKRVHTRDRILTSSNAAPVTLSLIVLSVAATLVFLVNPASPILGWLSISERFGRSLPEVCHGEVWRLLTPIFIHFGMLHIIFNMLMLRDMGFLVESRQGARVLILLVIIIGVGSNLGQYYYNGPAFGGMSGVLYGLLGYIWLRGHRDPSSGLYLSPMTLGMMLVWFFLCLLNVIPNVANACHAVGLVMGMIIGAAPLGARGL
jgi:GlpG protein